MFKNPFYLITALLLTAAAHADTKTLFSPDKRIEIIINIATPMTYKVLFKGNEILKPSPLSMTINGQIYPDKDPSVKKSKQYSVNKTIIPAVAEKFKTLQNNYNELIITFKKKYTLIFRAYNDGVAYRFKTGFNKNIRVDNELIRYNFPKNYQILFPKDKSVFTHQERLYLKKKLSDINDKEMGILPALIKTEDNTNILISEADVYDYPGFYLTGSQENPYALDVIFPHYPLKEKAKNDRSVPVTQYADYLAKTSGQRTFPWRALIITDNDGALLTTTMIYKLAQDVKIKDTSWIKPGKVAWDWWNNWQLINVDFKAGINTETYKYYIDFAAKNNLEYIIMDEGWSDTENLLKIVPKLNMQEVIDYGKKKDVGVILWCVWYTLDKQLQPALDAFQKWGIKGIKVDFMQRDDQKMVDYYWKIAREAAKRHLLVDFHGAYKPTGLRRAYPNVINREGVLGLEHNKWSKDETPQHDLTIPFTRMALGPMDFTPGAMINANKKNFRAVFDKPMSQGTRCHQLAMFIIYDAPLQMLADSPSNYTSASPVMNFLSKVPTTWDDTKVIMAKVSEYIVVARKKDNEWYLGAMTNWTPREFEIDLSFLSKGGYGMDIYQDGLNAGRNASDLKNLQKDITNSDKIIIKMAPGGGFAARIYKK